jgi:hypothetical protein
MYKIINDQIVQNLETTAFSSISDALYQEWLAAGNTPEPATTHAVIPDLNAAQIRMQLTVMGLRDAVETAVSMSTDRNLHDLWQYSPRFDRNNPALLAMAQQLNVPDTVLDQLFLDGAKL